MLKESLRLEDVILAGHPHGWPRPLNLSVGLLEFVLVEGADWEASLPLLHVMATLARPLAGQVRHWGLEAAIQPHYALFDLRRRMAIVAHRETLLHRLTVLENITLPACYYDNCSIAAALQKKQGLVEHFGLGPHLGEYPRQLSKDFYYRVVWVRELIQEPELLLVMWEAPRPETQELVLAYLKGYLARRQGAALFFSPRPMTAFHPLADRILRPGPAGFEENILLEDRGRPLLHFLPLIHQ